MSQTERQGVAADSKDHQRADDPAERVQGHRMFTDVGGQIAKIGSSAQQRYGDYCENK